MALVAIPHVIVSHFAIGGGLLIALTETLASSVAIRSCAGSPSDRRWC